MSTIPLRADAALIVQMLRLGPLGAEITGVRFDDAARALVFDVSVPDAPADATEMTPVYKVEYPSERYVMTDPGYAVPQPEPPARADGCICGHPAGWSSLVGHSAPCQIQHGYPAKAVPCARCKGRGKVPDWPKGLNAEFGEPTPKPCPDCQGA